MHIDIDSLLDSIDGWDLSVSVAGNQFIVDPPPRASRELLEKILSGDSITDADRPELEKLIGPLIRESSVDLANWGFSQLVGVATAIAVKAKEIYIAHSRGICRAVALAVRTPQSPKSPAAAIPDAPGVGQAAVSPAAPHRAGEAAAMIHDVPASNQAKTVASAPQLGPAAAQNTSKRISGSVLAWPSLRAPLIPTLSPLFTIPSRQRCSLRSRSCPHRSKRRERRHRTFSCGAQ